MKLTIYKYPEEQETYIWVIDLKERYVTMWYEEQMNRFWAMSINPNEKDRNNYTREYPVFDIDESYEIWQISLDHLAEMIKFLKENIK